MGTETEAAVPASFRPIRIVQVELGEPLAALQSAEDASGWPYERGLALVRLHGQPIGAVDLDLAGGTLESDVLLARIRAGLGEEIARHLRADGQAELPGRSDAGTAARPRCRSERDAFLARAPFASVVVATRDRPDSLTRCLDSMRSLVYPEFEVVVVDNAPRTDATARLFAARGAAWPNTRYVREDRPGLASAHNRGVREMRLGSPLVAFIDDDVVVDPDWLAELARGFEAAPNVGCVTGMIFPAELETWPQVLIEQFGGFNKGYHRQVFDLGPHRPPDPLFPYAPGRFGSGANMAFRSAALETIGGFDSAIGTGTAALGGDDLAAFVRIVLDGYALVYEPAAIVHHAHYRDYAALRRQVYGYGVGLTAYLAKTVVDRPSLLVDLLRQAPRGIGYALHPGSAKNRKKAADYPAELTALERRGMLYGPIAYARSRRADRRLRPGGGQ